MEEASVFVHVAVNDVTGKARTPSGIKGLFHKHPKQASLDGHAAAQHSHKHPFGAHLLRRTASAPTKGQPKIPKGFPEITNDNSSEGASVEREPENKVSAAVSHQPTTLHQGDSLAQEKGQRDHPDTNGTIHPEEAKDCLAEQNRALNISNIQVTGTVLLPEEHQRSHQSLSPLLYSSSTAISAEFQSIILTSEALDCSIKESGDAEKLPALSRTSPLSLMDRFETTLQLSQDTQSSRLPEMLLEQSLIQMQPFKEPKEDSAVSSLPVPAATVIREELFSNLLSNRPVRRTKSEAFVLVAGQTQIPAVCTDATIGDQLWSKLRPSSQRESMSSSSSISSSDTVIDLSLPNPVVKNFNRFSTVSNFCDPTWVTCSRSPLTSRQSQLYMEELKRSSVSKLQSPATSDFMSKSLGDLTSEDMSCHFESTYHSISRSFLSRPTREQNPKDKHKPQPGDNQTEQLRQLASVELLTAKDFAVECRAREMAEEATGARRTSRSHSRVRYIANRTKKAQERQRIQGRSASFNFTTCAGSSSRTSPIEEWGNPEGACSSAQSTCTSQDLLEQLNLLASQSLRVSRLPAESNNTEVFFLLRL